MNKYNLDIQTYSLKDLLNLFNLNEKDVITIEDIKRAKLIVLKMHPDKSKLSSDYFLFYKKSFDLVVEFYKEQSKINQEIQTEEYMYNPKHEKNEINEVQIKKAISKLDVGKFQETFNQLFDSNMKTNHETPEKNRWKQDNTYEIPTNMTKTSMNENFNKMKQQQSNQHLILYKGVQELHSIGGNPFYDDDEEDASNYITSDPFSKLKFDDLRKVHLDQTIFSVSENDFDKVKKYKSYNDLQQSRSHNLTPINKPEAQRMLDLQEKQMRENMMKKEYHSKLQTMQYDEKRKSILSKFLLLK